VEDTMRVKPFLPKYREDVGEGPALVRPAKEKSRVTPALT